MADSMSTTQAPRTVAPRKEESGPPSPVQPPTPEEELLLQQLEQARFWSEKKAKSSPNGTSDPTPDSSEQNGIPDTWDLTRGIVLHDWQEACVDAWFKAGKRGVIKVVTGAGKTILALAIAEKLHGTERPSLRVAIIVPTIVLLDQWRDELATHGNLPARSIGLMGGGHSDTFNAEIHVLIAVLNSAARKLPAEVEKVGIHDLLLIVDECHRAGASEMKHVLTTKRSYSLGLSATPERTDDPGDSDDDGAGEKQDEPLSFDESVLGKELGPVIFELNYAEAIRRGVLPPFRIVHYGLSLTSKDRERSTASAGRSRSFETNSKRARVEAWPSFAGAVQRLGTEPQGNPVPHAHQRTEATPLSDVGAFQGRPVDPAAGLRREPRHQGDPVSREHRRGDDAFRLAPRSGICGGGRTQRVPRLDACRIASAVPQGNRPRHRVGTFPDRGLQCSLGRPRHHCRRIGLGTACASRHSAACSAETETSKVPRRRQRCTCSTVPAPWTN